jgi:hypothetical protein
MRIGAKAKVIDWRSVYSGEVVELIEETDDTYVFANAKHKRGTLTVRKNVAQEFISWEREQNDA